jgi:hypothetical protein
MNNSNWIKLRLDENGEIEVYWDEKELYESRLYFIKSCIEIIENYPDIDYVLDTCKLLLHSLEIYKKETPNIKYLGEYPADMIERIKSQKIEIINNALVNMYKDALKKALLLKTEKGRLNRIDNFLKDLKYIINRMPEETQEFYEILKVGYKSDVLMLETAKFD